MRNGGEGGGGGGGKRKERWRVQKGGGGKWRGLMRKESLRRKNGKGEERKSKEE